MPSASKLSKLVMRAAAALLPLTFLSLPFLPLPPIGGGGGNPAPTPTPTPVTETPVSANAEVNVDDFGASGADANDDTTAIQAANDRVRVLGGGTVRFGSGSYLAAGVLQDSDVAFVGAGAGATTIRHNAPTGIKKLIESRQYNTIGTISKASTTLTVSNPVGIVPGALIAIKGAGGAAAHQKTKLTIPAFKGSNGLNVDNAQDFATLHDSRYLLIGGTEVVQYYRTNGTSSFSDLNRGRWGTAAKYHAQGTEVAQVLRLVAQVVSVAGTKVTIDTPAKLGVKNVEVTTGSYRTSVRSLTLDGNQPAGNAPSQPWPLWYPLARWATVADAAIINGEDGGIRLDSARDSTITRTTFRDSGDPTNPGAAHIWLFRGSIRNTIADNVFTGFASHAVCIDDRTVDSTEYDGGSDHNVVERNQMDVPHATDGSDGVMIEGSNDNIIRENQISNAHVGVSIDQSSQGLTGTSTNGADPHRNTVSANTMTNHRIGIRVSASQNAFRDNTIVDSVFACRDYGTANNTFENNTVLPSGTCP